MEQESKGWYHACSARLPIFSLLSAIIALISCCNPPQQFLFGAAAVILAILSKNETSMDSMAKTGMVIGILSMIASLIVFFQYIAAMHIIGDPANAALVQEVLQQYKELFQDLSANQP